MFKDKENKVFLQILVLERWLFLRLMKEKTKKWELG